MGKAPDELRQEIEETRSRMGETVEAIGFKADVPSRAKEKLSETKESMMQSVRGAKDRATSAVAGATDSASNAAPTAEGIKHQTRRATGFAQENPIGLAAGAIAVGFLAGLALPATRVEQERMGPIADEVKDIAVETGREVVDKAKEVAQEASQNAMDTARSRGQEEAQDVASSVQERASEVTGRMQGERSAT
jgi:gas vesicle protein